MAGMIMDGLTIFAVATAVGRAGVAMTRVSGPGALDSLCRLGGLDGVPPARYMTRVRLRNPSTGHDIDDALVVAFPAPGSFTGEDVVEFYTHGGRAVSMALIEALSSVWGLRLAEPGECSRRAFENGKMDLTSVEAIADLVAAETAGQHRQALRQLDGELGLLYDGWRSRLLGAMAHLEATIDFSEEDIPDGLGQRVMDDIAKVSVEIKEHLDDDHRGERLRDGFQIAIIGAPNVGKSSLLNRLAQRDAAIVSETAGTTRDVIEVRLDLSGYPVTLVDTAGIRESLDAVEREGVRRSRDRADKADLVMAVFDAYTWPNIPQGVAEIMDSSSVLVVNKSDLRATEQKLNFDGRPAIPISALTGDGIDSLISSLSGIVDACFCAGGNAPLTKMRHRIALEECLERLEQSLTTVPCELAAEDLRLASRSLGQITGRVDVEDILDIVFREFCIGK
jgi:tRNA modification GTPase